MVIAGTPPSRGGLRNAYPADALVSASYDGYGTHGQFGVVIRDQSVVDSPAGMTSAEARMAVRALVCTVQNGTDAPVVFFLHRKSVSSVWGQPLIHRMARDAHCPH